MVRRWPPLSLVFVLCGSGLTQNAGLFAQESGSTDRPLAEDATRTMVAGHFANVAAFVDGPRLYVLYENARYRDDRCALREAAGLLLPKLKDQQELVLVPTDRAIPLITARLTASTDAAAPGLQRDERGTDRQTPDVSIDVTDLPGPLLETPRASASFGRIEVLLHPWFEAAFGDVNNPVASRTGVAPEVRVPLRPGLSLSAQALITIQDDLPTGESRVRPALITLNQTVRLPRNVFVSATAGTFNPDRYGADVEARVWSANGRRWAGAEVALTGATWYADHGWYRTPMRDRTALVEAGWRIAPYDVVMRATAGVFLEAERGVRVDLLRQFGELEIGWFLLASEDGANGGFTLRIPLLPARYGAPAPVRLRAADAYRWQYSYRGSVPSGRRFHTGNALEEFGRELKLSDYDFSTPDCGFGADRGAEQ